MSVSEALGEPRSVGVAAGTIDYRERGDGRPIVFVHGVGVNGDLWRHVVPELARDFRCIAPDLPLGAHSRPLRRGLGVDADLSLPGLARLVADFLAALDLDGVAIVANDTGGAVAQWLVGHHPERIGALVLTSCDAFEKFPPSPQLYLKPAARVPGLLRAVAWAVQFKPVQRTPTAYGWTTKRPIDPAIMRSYTDPVRTVAGVRGDLARLLLAVDTRYTHEAAESLRGFNRPALVLWAADDKLFPRDHGRRLADLLPQGRFETIADSRTFIPEEQPERLVAAVREFLVTGPDRAPSARAAAAPDRTPPG
jgi:pimeloyl-ACP methyl ester carboxylesterase